MAFFKFFASAKGRKFTFIASVSAALGCSAINYFPHTFLAWKHREIVASYKEGIERPVSEVLKKRFEIAIELLKVTDFERKFIKAFTVSGFDLYHLGSAKFRSGGLIGIPVNYSYTAIADINKMDVIIRGNPVDWNSKGGQYLEQSLVLNEDEQIFGLAREIIQLQNNSIYLNSLYPAVTIFMYYALTSGVNSKLRLFYRPLSLRVMLYAISGFFAFGVYSFATDFTQVS